MTFPAQSPDLRRFPLVAGASRSVIRSPRSAAPRIRFLSVDSRVRFTLRSAYASRRTPCASLRSLRPGSGRTFTSKSSPMPGPPQSRRARPFGRTLPVQCERKARGSLKVKVRAPSYRSRLPSTPPALRSCRSRRPHGSSESQCHRSLAWSPYSASSRAASRSTSTSGCAR